MQLLLAYAVLFTEAMVAGGMAYMLCLWLFRYVNRYLNLLIWATLILSVVIYLLSGGIFYFVLLLVVLIPVCFCAFLPLYFLGETVPSKKDHIFPLGYIFSFGAHLLGLILFLMSLKYFPVDRLIEPIKVDPTLLALCLVMVSPTLAAFQIWWWKKTKSKLEDGF